MSRLWTGEERSQGSPVLIRSNGDGAELGALNLEGRNFVLRRYSAKHHWQVDQKQLPQ